MPTRRMNGLEKPSYAITTIKRTNEQVKLECMLSEFYGLRIFYADPLENENKNCIRFDFALIRTNGFYD